MSAGPRCLSKVERDAGFKQYRPNRLILCGTAGRAVMPIEGETLVSYSCATLVTFEACDPHCAALRCASAAFL